MAYETCANCGAKKHQLNACPNCGFTRRKESIQYSNTKQVIEREHKTKFTPTKKKSRKIKSSLPRLKKIKQKITLSPEEKIAKERNQRLGFHNGAHVAGSNLRKIDK